MSGEKRRENLLKILQESDKPVSGTKLAEKFQVSRQVVVQDIAYFVHQIMILFLRTKAMF